MPDLEEGVQELRNSIQAYAKTKAAPLKEVGFRVTGIRYARERDLLSGAGADFYGGRWNPKGQRAVYFSLDLQTAVSESHQQYLRYGITSGLQPKALVHAKIRLYKVLDFESKRLVSRIGFSTRELTSEPWEAIQEQGLDSWTQAIGRACQMAGVEGIKVPSALGGSNIVIFPANMQRRSRIEIIGRDKLPT